MHFPGTFNLRKLALVFVFWTSSSFILGSEANGQDEDRGSQNPILNLKSKFSEALSQAEKAIPRRQKYQILNQARHRLKSGKESKSDAGKHLVLALEYRRFRFYPESIQLLTDLVRLQPSDKDVLRQAHRALGELKFVADNDREAAIENYEQALRYSPEDSRDRADLLGRLGSYYFINDQIGKMKQVYQRFNRLSEKTKNTVPDSYLKANLYSGRFTDDPDEAEKFMEKAREIVEDQPNFFSPDLVLSVIAEKSSGQPWNSPARIKRLAKLVTDQKFAKQPQAKQIAMEVLLAYFLERNTEWKRFESFASQLLNLLRDYHSDKTKKQESASLACQAIAIHSGAAAQTRKKWNQNQHRQNYREWSQQQKRLKLYFPAGMNDQQRQETIESFTAGVKLLQDPARPSRRSGNADQLNRK